MHFSRSDLSAFQPQHDAFVGIDSDGCVFDTMEVKQKQCFHGLIVSHWHLEPIEAIVRRAAEFVNLYSCHRGQNRFPGLLKSIDLIRELPEVRASGITLPTFDALRAWIDEEPQLGNPTLERKVQATHDPELARVLDWSLAVNQRVSEVAKGIPPFEGVRECLEMIRRHADAIVISQTPEEALIREWDEHGIRDYVSLIAGQELGTKAEHIALATQGRYAGARILMLGDAPGDAQAAAANQALFYPINPGDETASWARFRDEGFGRFLDGTFAGDYQAMLLKEFTALLPETPDWG